MAVAAKAKGPASDSIMMPDKMKPLLATSKKEPVSAAIALTADGEGLMLLDKKAKPKKVLGMLRAEAGKAKLQLNGSSLRFGRAEVDPEYDASMVRLFLNKDSPGNLRAKLVEIVKRASYQKVELNVDAALEEEPEDETAGQEETASTAPPETAAPTAPPPQAPKPPAVEPQLDAGALARDLAGLARQLGGLSAVEPAEKVRLVKLATDANVNIKTNNLKTASGFIDQLKQGVAAAGGGGSASQPTPEASPVAPPPGNAPETKQGSLPEGAFVKMQKSRLIWESTRKRVAGEIERLKDAIAEAVEDDPDEVAVLDAIDEFDEVLEHFDTRLLDTLDSLLDERTPAENREKLLDEAKKAIDEYTSYAQSSPLVKGLEGDTPVGIKLTVASTMATTLKALQASLH